MGHQIQARRPYLVLINKEINCHLVEFAVPADHRVNIIENKKIYKYLDLTKELNINCLGP